MAKPTVAEATRVAQAVISLTRRVATDGIWGPSTEAAFRASPQQQVVRAAMTAVRPDATPELAYAQYKEGRAPKAQSVRSPEIVAVIKAAAKEFGESEEAMLAKADAESSFDPNAVKGSFAGLYQMGPAAWSDSREYVISNRYEDIGDYEANKFNARQNARAAAAYRKKLRTQLLAAGYAGTIDEATLYLAHMQGARGLVELHQAAQGILPLSASRVEAMVGNPPQDRRGVTVDPEEFIKRWTSVVNSRIG